MNMDLNHPFISPPPVSVSRVRPQHGGCLHQQSLRLALWGVLQPKDETEHRRNGIDDGRKEGGEATAELEGITGIALKDMVGGEQVSR